jgi:hypothetical protein
VPKIVMDGSKDELMTNTDSGEYSGYIDLSNMQVGDTIILTCEIYNFETQLWVVRESKTYSGLPSPKIVEVRPIVSYQGIKFSATQTTGSYREVQHWWFKR